MSSAPSPRNSEAPTPEAEVRANDLALMIGDGGPEAEEEGDDDLFGEDNDEDVKMDGVEHGKQESTGSLSPRLEPSRLRSPLSSASSKSNDSDQERDAQPDDGLTDEQRRERKRMEYDEDGSDDEGGQMGEEREMTTVEVKVNKWEPLEGSKPGERYTIRLPKQILHETIPYSQANYHEPEEPTVEGEDDGESKLNPKEIERRKAETLLHQVEHTMRWRWAEGADGTMIKQSNTRIIRWSDGSLSLQLGPPSNLFDIVSSSTASASTSATASNSHHHPTTYIVAHHQEAELLQSEGPIAAKLTLVPANLKGDMHQKLAKSVKGRNEKGSRLKIWDEKNMVAAMGEDGISSSKKTRKTKGPGSGGKGSGTKRGSGGGGKKRASTKRSGSIDSEDEDDSDEDEEIERRRSAKSSKKKSSGRVGDDEEGRYQEDGFVVDDSGSNPSDAEPKKGKGGKGKGKRRASPTMSSDDEAEAVESEEDDARDIESEEMESEEDDEEAAGESIKKRRIVLNEEEEEEE